ncbi:hypothetical protein [Flavobacterium sp. 316]|uniref:hypothetical protein n=1 Tax=Flavobacterium sp. 316 TaxID=1603293 RepID=UPI0005FA4770|nr:hypothetical protein [Flavobacterium sp. 316]
MENIFLISEEEVMDNFKKQNPTKEDYYDIICESEPEFLKKYFLSINPSMTNDDIAMQTSLEHIRKKEKNKIKRDDIRLPEGFEEIEVYDENKTFEENFKSGKSVKYLLNKVTKDDGLMIGTNDYFLPTSLSKCVIDIEKVEKYGDLIFVPVNYDAFFSYNLLSFKNYNSNFFLVDERIMFEALLIKFKSFDYKAFYWSKEKILEEVGIKKDRSTKILGKFIKLGIVSKELKKSFIDNRPMQINYYNLIPDKIIDLLPDIYKEKDDNGLEAKMIKYLMPVLNEKKHITKKIQ